MSPMEPEDELARLRAQMDQAVEGMKEFVRGLWGIYTESLDAGFDEGRAFELTLVWMAHMMQGSGEDE